MPEPRRQSARVRRAVEEWRAGQGEAPAISPLSPEERRRAFLEAAPLRFGPPLEGRDRFLTPPALLPFEPPTPAEAWRDVPPGGWGTQPPIAGIIPPGTGFEAWSETLGLPWTLGGGLLIDAFNSLMGRPTGGGILESPVDIIKRQQARGFVPRLASEMFSPFEVGAVAGLARGGAGVAG